MPSNFLNGSRGTTTTTAARTKGAPAAATTATWSVTGMYAASSLNLVAVACPSTTQCYAVGETTVKSAMVLASTDGGTTWAQQYVPVGGMLNAVACSIADHLHGGWRYQRGEHDQWRYDMVRESSGIRHAQRRVLPLHH